MRNMIDFNERTAQGYILQDCIDNIAIITWDNGSNKYTTFRLNIYTSEWYRDLENSNYDKRLPKYIIKLVRNTCN